MAARWAHNPKVASSSLAPATNHSKSFEICYFLYNLKKATKKQRKFETSYSNAMENKSGVNTIGANVTIDINYNENPVGYLSGDYYFINISRGEY